VGKGKERKGIGWGKRIKKKGRKKKGGGEGKREQGPPPSIEPP